MTADELDRAFAALADPTRRAIVARLAAGEATVKQLAEPFEMTQPSISKHLKVLERAGLIARGRAAQTRPCRLQPAPLQQVAQWVGTYRSLWEESFDRLEAVLQPARDGSDSSTPSSAPPQGGAEPPPASLTPAGGGTGTARPGERSSTRKGSRHGRLR